MTLIFTKKLLETVIDAIGYNAAETLDRTHGDKLPAIEGLDGLIKALTELKK